MRSVAPAAKTHGQGWRIVRVDGLTRYGYGLPLYAGCVARVMHGDWGRAQSTEAERRKHVMEWQVVSMRKLNLSI